MFTIAYLLVVELGLGLDLVSGWSVIMHTYLYCFRLSLSHCPIEVLVSCFLCPQPNSCGNCMIWIMDMGPVCQMVCLFTSQLTLYLKLFRLWN